ncbi:hypothetical protein SNK03_006560 [Fusarium graminearum]|uniref:Chromosome 2, complete genome n=1 Tax=Gibberella zeae (strain ATCC MYA-4620 / CBS 123657 / FGSC 9075 / NRRL 31084 / PH-1) TaxID=229533 RepID=I1RJ21_GIBZE|nr:hypothetical protein FGSG_03820 [Fusarium graminearum PH-1]ESU09365.1 hypothetical protein FGSG_03820 [Fusarium graminearum PH-1]CEF78696.1 unnamed protein product [Fusarium graminearum]|eukprot:XP_011321864.1 hypothetical protein FGSG_03820 [Fusarium graminearum PH-1]
MMRSDLFLLSTLISGAYTAQISVGQQQQSGGKNYHVAWWEGDTPCDGLGHLLGSVDKSLCSFDFQLQNQGSVYHFAYCGTDDLAIYRNDGSLYGKCSTKDFGKKLKCQNSHDIIKQYVCG